MRRFLVFLFVVLCLSAAGWAIKRRVAKHTLETVHPVRGPAVQAIYATGTVEGSIMLPLAPRVSGRLKELLVDEGTKIQKGQVLAKLDDEEMRSTVLELRAREEYARQEVERQRVLLAKSAASREAYERAQSEWDAAKAARSAADARTEYLTVLAPFDGRVIRRDGEIGEMIGTDKALFWISAHDPLRISAEVDEEDIPMVREGQEVLVRADAFPGQTFNGTILSITPKGDPIQRSYRVRIGFPESAPLQIGMTAENNIIVRRTHDALLVPSTAVSQNKVWLLENGALKQRAVTLGARGLEQSEILSGLTETDVVIIQPRPDFQEGVHIRTTLRK